MSRESNTFKNIFPSKDTSSNEDVITSFLKRKLEKCYCPWDSKGGGMKSESGAFHIFGYGWEGPVVAYWNNEKLYLVRGKFLEAHKAAAKARNSILKEAKAQGITPLWGKYAFEMEGKSPIEATLKVVSGRPFGVVFDDQVYKFADNLGLLNGEGVSVLESSSNEKRPSWGGCTTNFTWSDKNYAMDDRNNVFRIKDLIRWGDELGWRQSENGELILWLK